jgi:hypothetical protein
MAMPCSMVSKKRSSSCFSVATTWPGSGQLRIGHAHLGDQVGHHLVEEGGAGAQLVAVADGAADDAAQHVAAAFVARDDAVGDQEGAGADVVGQHLERRAVHVGIAGLAGGGLDQAWNRSIS